MLIDRAYRSDRPRTASADPVGAEDPQDPRDGRGLPAPVLVDDLAPRLPDQMTQHRGGDDGVVERTEDGDELRDQVDRRREPDGGEAEPELRAPRDPLVSNEVLEQEEQVRHESDELAGGPDASERDEREYRGEPERDGDREPDQQSVCVHVTGRRA